jgi:hypothetical protein
MDFAFTPEQEALRREVRALIKREMTPEVTTARRIRCAKVSSRIT